MGEVIRLTPSNTRCATCGKAFVAPTTVLYQDGKAYHQGACPTPDPHGPDGHYPYWMNGRCFHCGARIEPCEHAACGEDRCAHIDGSGHGSD